MQYKHTAPGSNVLRRDALSHFVEINTKFMSSQPPGLPCPYTAQDRHCFGFASGAGSVGIHPSTRISRLLVSLRAVRGGLRPRGRGLGSTSALPARGSAPRRINTFIRFYRSALTSSDACDGFSRCVPLPPGRPEPLGHGRPPAFLMVWAGR